VRIVVLTTDDPINVPGSFETVLDERCGDTQYHYGRGYVLRCSGSTTTRSPHSATSTETRRP
jgi:hypothetical protein